MAVDDIYKLDYVFVQDGREWMIGEHYRISIDDPAKTPVEIAAGMVVEGRTTFFNGEMDQLLSDEVELTAIVAQLIHPTIDFGVEAPQAAAFGAVAQPPLPAHSAQLIGQSGEAAGRTYQGRVYLSGVPITFQDAGRLTALAESEFTAHGVLVFGAHVMVPITPSPLRMKHTNYSRKRKTAIPPEPPVFSDIQAASLRPSIGTQRNRSLTTDAFEP